MKENKWLVAGKGLIVGATMIVPGVSGGTMAIILGIYDKLISAVSSFAKNAKEKAKKCAKNTVSVGKSRGSTAFTIPPILTEFRNTTMLLLKQRI